MSISGDGSEPRELNHLLQGENKRDEDAVFSDDFEVNDPAETIIYGQDGALQDPSDELETSLQQDSQGSVCWERFLHVRSLKVLLVENDTYTRHVVTSLLRNCSYEVTEAENGLQAWKILEDPTNQIDLVLTEMVMPDLSGMGLLHEIMNHNTRNNVPVIMMSTNDSMSTVFKCLSKGAVDFLVKPIRKNELKNLWQHVWRRCHSSRGSGSESDAQTQKSVKSKGVEKYDNDYGGDDEYDNGSMGLNVGDGSDNGSGTQSYWTKQAVDMDSPQSASAKDQVAIFPDSTCAQVLHSNTEVSGNKQTPVINVKTCAGCDEQLDDATCKDKERVVGNVDVKLVQAEDPTKFVGMAKQKHILEKGSGKLKEKIDEVHLDLNNETLPNILCRAANLTGSTANTVSPFTKDVGIEGSIRRSKIPNFKTKALNDAKDTPSVEHDLKRLREDYDVGTAVQEDRNVLRRSDALPFSRYNTLSNAKKDVGVNIISGCPPDSTLAKTKEGPVRNLQSHPKRDHRYQSSNIDMGSTTNHIIPESIVLQNISTASSSAKHLHPPTAFQPSTSNLLFATQQIQPKEAENAAIRKMLVQSTGNPLFANCQQCSQPHGHLDASSKEMVPGVPHCGSSSVLGGPFEGSGGNYISLNRSASGSNQGSNELNGISAAVNTEGINLENDNGIAGKFGNASENGLAQHQNKFNQIKAVLTKFRQKKKERRLRKKVRLNSRKKRRAPKTTNNSSSKKQES